jgi:hypothetical protein
MKHGMLGNLLALAFLTLGMEAQAVEVDGRPRTAPVGPQLTMAKVPSGIDTYSAQIDGSTLGAAAVGVVDGRSKGAGGLGATGGFRAWGTLLDRVVAQAEVGNDAKSRFVPSVALAARVLGNRKIGWAAGVLARYRTEGFSTIEGEIEGGLLGSYAKNRLHLDAGLIVGVGIEEEEADGEALLRFGYDLSPAFRLGLESRVRRELAEEEELGRSKEGEEWDAFAGAQATLAFDQFFGCLTAGPQKTRVSEDAAWMAQLTLGGVAF